MDRLGLARRGRWRLAIHRSSRRADGRGDGGRAEQRLREGSEHRRARRPAAWVAGVARRPRRSLATRSPMSSEIVSENKAHGGRQLVCRHASTATGTGMTFSVFLPLQAEGGAKLPVVWYLSGLTCTHANVTEKGEYRAACADLGLVFVAPDTSPRGEGVPTAPDGGWDLGLGAGFYVDASEEPWSGHYRMWTYVTDELPALIAAEFPA